MTPKPLTKEERWKLDRWLRGMAEISPTADLLRHMVTAEAFWREAVKNADWWRETQDSDLVCGFCECKFVGSRSKHKPDCPWLLAQDGE